MLAVSVFLSFYNFSSLFKALSKIDSAFSNNLSAFSFSNSFKYNKPRLAKLNKTT